MENAESFTIFELFAYHKNTPTEKRNILGRQKKYRKLRYLLHMYYVVAVVH